MSEKLTKLNPDDTDEVFADVEVDAPDKLPVPAGTKITVAEAKRVAKQAGLVGVDARKMAGLGKFGKYLKQIGVEKIGGVYLAFTGEQLRKSIEEVDLLDADLSADPELQMRGRELKKELIKLMIETGKTMLKAGEGKSGPQGGLPQGQLPPFPPGVAVQFNVTGAQPPEVKVG